MAHLSLHVSQFSCKLSPGCLKLIPAFAQCFLVHQAQGQLALSAVVLLLQSIEPVMAQLMEREGTFPCWQPVQRSLPCTWPACFRYPSSSPALRPMQTCWPRWCHVCFMSCCSQGKAKQREPPLHNCIRWNRKAPQHNCFQSMSMERELQSRLDGMV